VFGEWFFVARSHAVPTSSDSDIRPLAHRILLVQTGAGATWRWYVWLVWGGMRECRRWRVRDRRDRQHVHDFRALQPARTRGERSRRCIWARDQGRADGGAVHAGLRVSARVWPALLIAYHGDAGGVLVGAVYSGVGTGVHR
jgi:hypothetical protein